MSLTKFNARIGDNLLEVLSSIQELKSLKHFNHAVLVLGANERDDEDGGIYYWYDNNTEENDDISVIQSNHNGNGRWKRLSFALNSSEDAPLNFEAESSKSVSFQQKNYSFGVASRFNVRATSDVDWITIGNIDKNELSHTINYSVSENINSSSREGVITIKNGFNTFTYVVTQDEVESVTGPEQLGYANEERSNNVANITSNTSWSATTDASWISLITSSGNGNAPIQFDLTENTNQFSDREGIITITSTSGYSSHTITVSQSQGASSIQDVIDQSVDYTAATGLSFIVNSDIGWTATTDTEWITITNNTGNDGDSVVYSVDENSDTDNDRTGLITLTSDNNINVISVNIIQSRKAAAFKLKIDTSLSELSNAFTISHTRNITIDWGDGSPKSSSTDTNTTAVAGFTHTYATEGEYTISINENSDEGCAFRFGYTQVTSSTKMVKEVVAWGALKPDSLLYFMSYCPNLTALSSDISDFDTSEVTDMRYAWHNCSSLTGTFPTIDTSNVTNMAYAWRSCSSLTSFPTINTSNVTNMPYAWNGCTSLTSFPSIDTSSVTDMASAWRLCTSLTSFPSIDTSSVTDMRYAWDNCRRLTSFPLINTSSVTDMGSAWRSCSSLTSFPSIDTSSVVHLGGTWDNCRRLTSFPLINTSNVTNMLYAWRSCSSLTSFPSIDTSSVTNMGGTWYGCTSLTSFPLINTSNVTNMSYAWRSCTSLTSFPSIDTSSVTNMAYAFQYCTSLTSFPSIDTSSVAHLGGTWYQCTSLTSFPSIDVSSNAYFTRTWYQCTNLSTFNPFSNTTYRSAAAEWEETWKGCNNLTFTSISNSPFANIGTTSTLPVSINYQTVVYRSPGESTYKNLGLYNPLPDGSTYYPPFDISGVNAIYIDDSGTNITDFNIIGWDQMTFDRVNYGADPNPTVEVDINATLANTEVDTILNELYSNLNNHTPIEGTSTYSINFHSNTRTSASDDAHDGLVDAGWDITLGS